MRFEETLNSFVQSLGESLPSLLGAIAILVVGWLVALVVRAGLRKVLGKLNVDRRVQDETDKAMGLEKGISQTAYYVVLVLAFVAFLNALKLELVSDPLRNLVNQVLEFLPQIVGAGALLLVAWLIATILRKIVHRVLSMGSLVERLGESR